LCFLQIGSGVTGRQYGFIGVLGISETVEPKTEDLFVLRREGHDFFVGFGNFGGPLEGVVGAELFLGGLLVSSFLPAAPEESAIGCPLHKVIINLIVIKSSEHREHAQRSNGGMEGASCMDGWFLREEMLNPFGYIWFGAV
jgi:hypothetical protein